MPHVFLVLILHSLFFVLFQSEENKENRASMPVSSILSKEKSKLSPASEPRPTAPPRSRSPATLGD